MNLVDPSPALRAADSLDSRFRVSQCCTAPFNSSRLRPHYSRTGRKSQTLDSVWANAARPGTALIPRCSRVSLTGQRDSPALSAGLSEGSEFRSCPWRPVAPQPTGGALLRLSNSQPWVMSPNCATPSQISTSVRLQRITRNHPGRDSSTYDSVPCKSPTTCS